MTEVQKFIANFGLTIGGCLVGSMVAVTLEHFTSMSPSLCHWIGAIVYVEIAFKVDFRF